MKTTFVTCDICGNKCGRWYEVYVSIGAERIQQNVHDMLEIDGVSLCGIGYIPPKCLCEDCMAVLIKAAKRMRKHSQPLQSN